QQGTRLGEASRERIRRAQIRHDRWCPASLAGGTTEGQAPLEHPDGRLQVPLAEVQAAEVAVDIDQGIALVVHLGAPESLFPVVPPLGKRPELAQRYRQPGSGLDPQAWTARLRCLPQGRYALPLERDRLAEGADGIVRPAHVMGGAGLQGAVAELG